MEKEIIIEQGDITDFCGDAIVNAANNELILGAGVAGAIARAGGPAIQEECYKHGPVAIGKAAITGAGNLKVKYVIHAASMGLGQMTNARTLKSSMEESLKLADEHGVISIALPAIGTGVAGFPIVRCAEIMISAAKNFLQSSKSVIKIHFILFDESSQKIFADCLNKKA